MMQSIRNYLCCALDAFALFLIAVFGFSPILALLFFFIYLMGCTPTHKAVEPTIEQQQPEVVDVKEPKAPEDGVDEKAAHNRVGFDTLALLHPKTDAGAIARKIKPGTPIGVLDYTFGTDIDHLETLLQSGRVGVVRVQLINAVCARNRRCQPSDGVAYRKDSRGLDKAIRAGEADGQVKNRTRLFKMLSEKHRTLFYMSPLLEHDQSKEAWTRLATLIRSEWPGVQLINSPHSGYDGRPLGALLERHHDRPQGADVNSLDGKDIDTMSSRERQAWRDRTRRLRYALAWNGPSNCLKRGESWKPPTKRTNCLTASGFSSLYSKAYN